MSDVCWVAASLGGTTSVKVLLLLLAVVAVPASSNDEQWARNEVRRWYGDVGTIKTYYQLHGKPSAYSWYMDKRGYTCAVGYLDYKDKFNQTGMGPTWKEAFEDAEFRGYGPGYRKVATPKWDLRWTPDR